MFQEPQSETGTIERDKEIILRCYRVTKRNRCLKARTSRKKLNIDILQDRVGVTDLFYSYTRTVRSIASTIYGKIFIVV